MKLARVAIWTLFALWSIAMILSLVALTAQPTGESFLRGLNRITGFLGWQLGAAILALILWLGVRQRDRPDPMRRLGRLPGWWAVVLLLLIVTWIAVGVIGSEIDRRQGSLEPERPTTVVPVD